MKHSFKTKCLMVSVVIVLLCFSFLLSGCSQYSDFIGTYKSTFVDSQNNDESVSFTLNIKKDKTFVLTKYYGENVYEFSGYYKSYTEYDKKQLLFIVEEGYQWNSKYPNAWSPYFSVCMLDDGTLMATAGSTSSSTSVVTAFGSGSITKITLILFAKE